MNKLCKIVDAEYLGGHSLRLTFNDGASGEVNLADMNKGVFAPLSNPAKFRQFSLENGVLCWDDNLDIAPEFLYRKISGNGSFDYF